MEQHSDQGLAAVSCLDDPVRRRLYEFVAARREPVGRDEAAAATGVGRPLAAYHLDKLVSLGLLTASFQRASGRGGPGAGRPAKRYARSASEFSVSVPPRDYELAARLLAAAVAADCGGTSRTALQAAARRFGSAIAAPPAGQAGPSAGAGPAEPAALRAEPAAAPEDLAGAPEDSAAASAALTALRAHG